MKICKKCGLEKEFIFFYKRKNSKDGYRNECIECKKKGIDKIKQSEKNRNYYLENRENILLNSNNRAFKNRDLNGKRIKKKILEQEILQTQKVCSKCYKILYKNFFTIDNSKIDNLSSWCNNCKNNYFVNRRKTNIKFKIISYLRSSLSESLSKNKLVKMYKTVDILGCSIDDFKKFIEKKFIEDMTWDNYGEWHLDHIIPISYATTEDELYKLSHYTNFQPLWCINNLKKGNRYIG